jgi:UDP:flavonoid glycosyltransferase YjiC (YdhE family)
MPRTAAGRELWRRAHPIVQSGLQRGRRELNETRASLGLPPLDRVHGGISAELAIVATFPQLEYPRAWPPNVHVVGPLMWEPPAEEAVGAGGLEEAFAERDARPLVLIAPSTAQDAEHRMLRAALLGLADLPVRVLGTYNRRLPPRPLPVPENAKVIDWIVYSREMPRSAVVVCHAGHGTLARALSNGCVVVACPAVGDMNENAARLDWAGAGVRVPRRFVTPRAVRLAVQRALGEPAIRARAREIGAWSATHDAGARASELVEQLAGRRARP